MSMPSPEITATHDQHGLPLDDVTQRGLAIYEGKLKSLLEPAHTGEVVAIHLDTGDLAIAASSPEAMRALRRLHHLRPAVPLHHRPGHRLRLGPPHDGFGHGGAKQMTLGEVRRRMPRVVLSLPGREEPLDIEFMMDTAFDGKLAVPADISPAWSLMSIFEHLKNFQHLAST